MMEEAQAWVTEGVASKSDVLAFIGNRNEAEVLVNPELVRVVNQWMVNAD
jgi:hypothetical protein